MSKKLVLAEKPSVGRDIARVLGCEPKGQSYMENSEYIVTWALGHLVTLASPERYNKAYTTWTLESLPMIPKPFKLEVIKNTSKQYQVVRQLMERSDVDEIIIGTDAGREGELVARWIIDYAGCKKPLKRLWISSVTDKAIKDGFNHLVKGSKYDNLYHAARARSQADWILGLNGTRALTVKHNASLSMGRVQTPTVGLVNQRELEIRQFVAQDYYEIEGEIDGIKVKAYQAKTGGTRWLEKSIADQVYQSIQNSEAQIMSVSIKEKETLKIGFYDLTELQRDANRQFGYSAKETLSTIQTLYERHKVLSYPRTDSKYITDDVVPTLIDRLRACRTGNNKVFVGQIIKAGIKGKASFVNNAKVGDHHGLIPTEVSPSYHQLSPKELKIYNLVVQRFLAVLMPPYRYEEVSLEAKMNQVLFRGKARKTIDLGWQSIYGGDDYTSGNASTSLHQGDRLKIIGLRQKLAKTSPPMYLTEADLLGQMEQAGLGTVATRADIIEKVVHHCYVDKQNKALRMTKTGKQLLELVPESIKSKELTAKWEQDLELIAKGKKDEAAFLTEIINFTQEVIKVIRSDKATFKHDNVSSETCPDCGKKLLNVENKFGKRLVCPDRDCGYKKNVAKATNARCPNCHKKLKLVGEGDKQTFVCSCGHKEKLSAFNKRKAGHKASANKRDVDKYLKKSGASQESFNNPFAALLGKIDEED